MDIAAGTIERIDAPTLASTLLEEGVLEALTKSGYATLGAKKLLQSDVKRTQIANILNADKTATEAFKAACHPKIFQRLKVKVINSFEHGWRPDDLKFV